MKIKLVLIVTLIAVLSACSSTSYIAAPPHNVYLDDQFNLKSTSPIETQDELFAMTPEMKVYVRTRLIDSKSLKFKSRRLIEDLFSEQQLNIQYQHDANYSASQTFEKGAANCLSLSILSFALANEANLKADILDVELEENWTVTRSASLYNGHVNLRLQNPTKDSFITYFDKTYTIDFQPMQNAEVKSTKVLTKPEITSLFYNNKGANALVNQDYSQAYVYLKAATLTAPKMASSWANLASLYKRTGHIELAEKLYLHALNIEPDNLNTQENLARLYTATNREELANKLHNKIDTKRQANPHYHAMLGEEAYFEENYVDAEKHFTRAIRLQNREHYFYFGLAKVYLAQGRYELAEQKLQKAHRLANEMDDKARYSSKINLLQNTFASR